MLIKMYRLNSYYNDKVAVLWQCFSVPRAFYGLQQSGRQVSSSHTIEQVSGSGEDVHGRDA